MLTGTRRNVVIRRQFVELEWRPVGDNWNSAARSIPTPAARSHRVLHRIVHGNTAASAWNVDINRILYTWCLKMWEKVERTSLEFHYYTVRVVEWLSDYKPFDMYVYVCTPNLSSAPGDACSFNIMYCAYPARAFIYIYDIHNNKNPSVLWRALWHTPHVCVRYIWKTHSLLRMHVRVCFVPLSSRASWSMWNWGDRERETCRATFLPSS